MQERRLAREEVLKALYAKKMSEDFMEDVENRIINESENLTPELKNFAQKLFENSVHHKDKINQHIKEQSENWAFSRIAVMDKLILRMAICEFFYLEDVPYKVSISEAIEIAKKYSTDDSSGFINGILDSVYHENFNEKAKS